MTRSNLDEEAFCNCSWVRFESDYVVRRNLGPPHEWTLPHTSIAISALAPVNCLLASEKSPLLQQGGLLLKNKTMALRGVPARNSEGGKSGNFQT